MRKIIYFILVFNLISCSTKEESKTQEIIENTSVTDLTPDEFNTFLTIRVNAIHEMIEEMQLLDENDAAPDVIISAANKNLLNLESIITEIKEINTLGELGAELKDLTLKYIGSKVAIFNVYIDFAPQLSIESEWTDEDYSLWTSNAEPYFGISDQILDEMSTLQEQFLDKNNCITKTEL